MKEIEHQNLIDTKVQYWKDLWNDSISNFLKRSFGLELLTPHVLIDNIILEIEEDSFQNKKNKKFFYRTINQFLKNDQVINEKFKTDFALLRRDFNSERNGYILSICQSLQTNFRNGKYFDGALKKISELLILDSPIDTEFLQELNYYTQSVIVELLLKSYTLEEIKSFSKYIFSDVEKLDDGRFYSHFPHKTDVKEYTDPSGEIDWKLYGNALKKEIQSLDTEMRINSLGNYFYEVKQDAYFIFVIEGLRGSQVVKFGDITFYSPDKKRFVKEGKDYQVELEDLQKDRPEEKYMQAAVKVNYLTYQSSLSIAINKLENNIDLIYSFFGLKTKIKVLEHKYLVVKDSKYLASSFKTPKENQQLKFHDSLDIDFKNNRKIFTNLRKHTEIISLNQRAAKKIRNAMHWVRKGDTAKNDDDKLVFYWVALENLFSDSPGIKKDILGDSNASKFDLIKAVLSANHLIYYVYEYGWDLFHYYRTFEDRFFIKSKFPERLSRKANLITKGSKVYLKKFIKCLPELKKHEDNPYLKSKIESLISFYNESEETIKTLEKQKTSIEDDIVMIYRFRNLIVHSATFDQTMLPYYTWKIKLYTKSLVRQLIRDFEKELDIEDIITKIYLKKEKYFERLKNDKIVFPEDLK
ncbi:hypothetical protein [Muricauda brasiliensis]|uniref:hypothetical protein n=1 Tax=Muricauda brasiliensis TaxID=2162892 RepID=UPI000D37900F|nr:hypothetical protein [Muricauda brasiliensis]